MYKNYVFVGAWWLGWILIGIVMFIIAVLIGFFPKKIRREKSTEEHELDSEKCKKIDKLAQIESTVPKENGDLKGIASLNDLIMINRTK